MVALSLTAAAVLGLIIVANATGPDTVGFVVTTTLLGFGLAPFVGDSLERHIPDTLWNRTSLSRDASRQWGVDLFNAVLSWIGWNRLVVAMRGNQATELRKNWDPRPMRASAAGHTWAFLLHLSTAIWVGVTGGWASPVVLLVVGVLGHLYPAMLQIRVLTRLKAVHSRRR